jgi:hypothetical protein
MMKPPKVTQQLPEDYQELGALDLNENRGLALILTLSGVAVMFGIAWLLMESLSFLRPEYLSSDNILIITGMREFWRGVLLLIVSMGLTVILNAGFRGLMFLIVTRQRPKLGFRGFYAYTSAPDWYIPRPAFLLISLIPILLITLLGIGAVPLVLLNLVPGVLLVISLNFGGALNDIVTAVWLLRKPRGILIQDYGDGVRVYGVKVETGQENLESG